MKKRMSLLLFSLLFVTQITCAKNNKKLVEKIDPVGQVVLNRELKDLKTAKCCGGPVVSCFESPDSICCKRGKRGKRGPRGHTGASISTINEIWMNALQMAGCGEGPLWPPIESASPYGGCTAIPAWALLAPLLNSAGAWGAFDMPANVDITKPVTVIVHLLIPSTDGPPIGNTANLQVQIAYLANNVIGGYSPPADGYTDTQVSGNFTVIPPDTVSDNNVRQLSIPISLDPALVVPDSWSFINIGRLSVGADEYLAASGSGLIFLSTLSIQYSPIIS
jgi:hypothetical protein